MTVPNATLPYDPFGMLLSGRSWEAGSGYRYGFGGQESDDEVNGNNNTYTASYWEYDARLGRRWNVDVMTMTQPGWSSYKAFNNNPLLYIDPTGAKEFKDYDEYKQYAKDNGFEALSADQIGSQGHWLTSD